MSFFKIPLEKLLLKIPDRTMGQTFTTFNESQWAMVEGLEENRFWTHIAARRTGKSYAAAILAVAKLLEPRSEVTVVAPNYNLSSIIWDYVVQLLKTFQIETDKFNQKDKIVVLINGSIFRLLSANNRDSLVGRGAHLIIVDEAAIIPDDEYFSRDLRPALSTYPDSRCLFISTPRGKGNYLYKYFLRGQPGGEDGKGRADGWGSAAFTWRSNPRLSEKDIEQARMEISEKTFQQEYECVWTTTETQIYSLDEDTHFIPLPDRIKNKSNKYEYIAGLDVGYRDATAFIVLATDGVEYYVVDEYIANEATTQTYAENMQRLITEWNIQQIYIDHAEQQMKADLAYEYDIYCDNANKNVLEGIAHVQVLIEKNRLHFSRENVPASFRAMQSYAWKKESEIPKPIHNEHSHACDAIRYAIYTHHKSQASLYV